MRDAGDFLLAFLKVVTLLMILFRKERSYNLVLSHRSWYIKSYQDLVKVAKLWQAVLLVFDSCQLAEISVV